MKLSSGSFFVLICFLLLTLDSSAKIAYQPVFEMQKQDSKTEDGEELKKLCDSLVLQNNFKTLLSTCKPYLSDPEFKKIVTPYLIAAYFFTGDTTQSRKILSGEFKHKSFLDIAVYTTGKNPALIKYFDIEDNREDAIISAQTKYMKLQKPVMKKHGALILRFFIYDQRIRKLKFAYVNADIATLDRVEKKVKRYDSIQNSKIYNFYRDAGKYFNKEEVGEEVMAMQDLLFAHVADIALRQNFYLPLLEKALADNVIDKETYVNFVLGTEVLKDPDFWNTIDKRLPQIRKKYGLTDRYLFRPL